MTKERTAWVSDSKKVRKLEAHLAEMEKAIAQLRSIHKNKLGWKDAFCKAERERVAKELHGTYNCMLPIRDQLQFQVGYMLGYSEAKEKQEDSDNLGEVVPTNASKGGNPETSYAREPRG